MLSRGKAGPAGAGADPSGRVAPLKGAWCGVAVCTLIGSFNLKKFWILAQVSVNFFINFLATPYELFYYKNSMHPKEKPPGGGF